MASTGVDTCIAASARAEADLRERLDAIVALLREGFGSRALALVLGGSLARGEGMVLQGEDGATRLLSDVDLYVVRSGPESTEDGVLRGEVQKRVTEDDFFLAPLDLAFVHPDYFARLGPTLPARQLAHGWRLLWEDPQRQAAWSRPESPAESGVDPEDAHRLLLNRMAESVRSRAFDAGSPFFAVHRMKTWIDAPLAWLAATGRYDPAREVQCERFARATRNWDGETGEWARDGVERAVAWIRAVRRQPLEPQSLREFAGVGDNARPRHAVPDPLVAWAWPFARAFFEGGHHAADPDLVLRDAVRHGPPRAEDVSRVAQWLRRGAWSSRLRQARRWAPLSPWPVSPWWRHGWGGSGEERMYAACALRWAGLDAWSGPLEALEGPRLDGEETHVDAALGSAWADWILGGGRR